MQCACCIHAHYCKFNECVLCLTSNLIGWRASEAGGALLSTVVEEEGDVDGHVETNAEDVGPDGGAEADGSVDVDHPAQQRAALIVLRHGADVDAEQAVQHAGAHPQLQGVDRALSSMVRCRDGDRWRRDDWLAGAVRFAAVHGDGGEEEA